MQLEIEAKYLNIHTDECRDNLARLGYTCTHERRLMSRYTYLLEENNEAKDGGKWARVRNEGDRITMTYKHAFDRSRIDGTEEVEFEVSSFEAANQFMLKLGFTKRLQQENYRETWRKGDIEVTLNEWPALAPLAEVEGPDEASVQAASQALGFDYTQAVFGGVGAIYKACNGWDMDFVTELTFARAEAITAEMNKRLTA